MANRPPPVPGERRALKRRENEKEEEKKNETGVLGEIAFIHQSFYTN